MKDIQQTLFAIFEGEHAQHLEQIRSILGLLSTASEAEGKSMLDEAFRRAHTLKGAARAVDLKTVEELANGLESVLARVREGHLTLDREVIGLIHQTLDSSEEYLTALQQQRTPPASAGVIEAMAGLLGTSTLAAPAPIPAELPSLPPRRRTNDVRSVIQGQPIEMVRLPGQDLERLVRSTGQLLVESSRQKKVTLELTALGIQIAEMESDCDHLRNASAAPLRHLAGMAGFDSVISYVETVDRRVRSMAGKVRAVRLLQQRSAWNTNVGAEQLRQDVWAARMTPAGDVFEGFGKMVRDLARDQGKELDFHLIGSDARADRVVLQALKDPVMHLLRNAVSHGVESPRQRESKGKSSVGRLTLRVECIRGRLVIEVDDDGGGIDLRAVAKVAVAAGLLAPAEAKTCSPEDLSRIVFRPGFSTSPTVNDISGRGMGLSVVYETVRRLQGEVNLKPRKGPGALVSLSVPLSVSTCHLIVVRSNGQTFGIPSHGIASLCRLKSSQIETVGGKPTIKLEGRSISLFRLSHLLRLDKGAPLAGQAILKVVVLRSGNRMEAVLVDEFVGDKDGLVQDLGFRNPPSGNVAGAMMLGDGQVVVVLNPAGLIANCTQSNAAPLKSVQLAPPSPAPRILVVDDSITARSLERSILEANGYSVQVAVDGMEGLQLARATKPDLIVTDLQMPRLDGFGLLEALKSDPNLRDIPVIIVSSVERTEDQQRGLVLGADAYVVKRKFDEQELLHTIRQIL